MKVNCTPFATLTGLVAPRLAGACFGAKATAVLHDLFGG